MEIKISRELNVIMNFARDEAMRTGSYGISPDHLFLGIIRHKDNEAARILQALGVDLDEFKQFIDEKIRTDKYIPFSEFEKVSLSRGAYNILSLTILEATRSMTDIVRPEHLLLAYTAEGSQRWVRTADGPVLALIKDGDAVLAVTERGEISRYSADGTILDRGATGLTAARVLDGGEIITRSGLYRATVS